MMKTDIKYLFILIGLVFSACTDVVDVDLKDADPRLTIEASLNWEKGTSGSNQKIKLSTSTPYFKPNIPNMVTGALVKVINNDSAEEFIFEDQGNGEYTTSSFVPVLNNSYTLEVNYLNEKYIATEKMISVTSITDLSQSKEDGASDEDLEVNVSFKDPKDEKNFYLFKFKKVGDLLPELIDLDDKFINGNEIKITYEKEEDEETDKKEAFVPEDIVDIEFIGISNSYYNYIRTLIEQSSGVDVFNSIPVALKGNCVNTTNAKNYAFGYFRVAEVVKTSYTFK